SGVRRGDGPDGLGALEWRQVEITHAAEADFSVLDQLADGRPALFDLFIGLGPVHLVEVDDVHAKPAQTGITFGEHAASSQRFPDLAAVAFPHAAALGRDEHLVTPSGD